MRGRTINELHLTPSIPLNDFLSFHFFRGVILKRNLEEL